MSAETSPVPSSSSSLTQVIKYTPVSGTMEALQLDLVKSTVARELTESMTFSYYWEFNDRTVFTAMTPDHVPQSYHIFVKLVHDEPVDLTKEELQSVLSKKSDFIPLSI